MRESRKICLFAAARRLTLDVGLWSLNINSTRAVRRAPSRAGGQRDEARAECERCARVLAGPLMATHLPARTRAAPLSTVAHWGQAGKCDFSPVTLSE